MREDIIQALQSEVKTRCESPDNFFGEGIYYHIEAVVRNSVFLAEKYGGDIEIVTIAAWLHDIASITDYKYYEEHHIYGAQLAEEVLADFNYPAERTELVKQCIRNHRGSIISDKHTVEEICIADGDAISHFDSIPSLFYLAYVKRGYTIQEGIDFVANKCRRSYQKLSDESRELYREKFDSALRIIYGSSKFSCDCAGQKDSAYSNEGVKAVGQSVD